MGDARTPPWHGRFLDVLPISAEAGFRLTAARDAQSGRECVVVSGAPGADPIAVRAALARAYDAHARISHPIIAPATELGPDDAFIVFDCPARLDLASLLSIARDRESRVRHSAADGFICALRDALFTAAEHVDPRDGGPICMGTLGHANVLFARDGRFWLIGLGHNVALADEHGLIGGRSTAFQAPEVSVGARPTRSSDFVTLLLFMRSLVPFVVLERSLMSILAGNSIAEDYELVSKLVWFERRVMNEVPSVRAPIDEALETSERIRVLLGVSPDLELFRQTVAERLRDHPGLGAGAAGVAWRMASDGSFVERIGGARAEIPGRGPLRRLVVALAAARIEQPGLGLSVEELFARGWPSERASIRAARNRVHVAISTLRRLALSTDLESHDGSYRITPAAVIHLVAPEAERDDSRLSEP